MNYGKLSMLCRIAGGNPVAVYVSDNPADLQKLHDYLQELCNHSRDLELVGNAVVSRNPFLAFHLQEVIKTQRMVPQSKGDCPRETMLIL